jgi:molybdenum storage protein
VKDEPGLMSADPKKDPNAEWIQEIEVQELIKMDLDDLPVERAMLEAMMRAQSVEEVLLVNGRERGRLTQALHGEGCGSRIYRVS